MAIHIDLTVIYSTKFREKTRERVAKKQNVRSRCSAHAKLDQRVPRVLRSTHIRNARGRVSAVFLSEGVRFWRSNARKISRENARMCCKILFDFGALRTQKLGRHALRALRNTEDANESQCRLRPSQRCIWH